MIADHLTAAKDNAMKMKKYWFAVAGGLFCCLLLVQPSPAGPSQLLNKGRQAVNVTATSDSSGIIPGDAVLQIKPDGSTAPFNPKDFVVMNQMFATFTTPTTNLNGPVTFKFADFYSIAGTINGSSTGSSVGFSDSVDPGIVIGEAEVFFHVVDANNNTIPGTLTMRGVGYLTPKF